MFEVIMYILGRYMFECVYMKASKHPAFDVAAPYHSIVPCIARRYVLLNTRRASHAMIFQSYMWRHRCAGGLKKMYLRSSSQRHIHFAGSFNVPVLHRHGQPFSYGESDKPPHLVAFCDTLGIRRTYSRRGTSSLTCYQSAYILKVKRNAFYLYQMYCFCKWNRGWNVKYSYLHALLYISLQTGRPRICRIHKRKSHWFTWWQRTVYVKTVNGVKRQRGGSYRQYGNIWTQPLVW